MVMAPLLQFKIIQLTIRIIPIMHGTPVTICLGINSCGILGFLDTGRWLGLSRDELKWFALCEKSNSREDENVGFRGWTGIVRHRETNSFDASELQ